jgi:branched-chain amino acid transport system substrate-binding protein
VMPIAKESGVFSSSNCAGSTRLDTTLGDMGFRTAPSDDYSGRVIAQMFLDGGYKEIGMIYENDEARTSVAKVVKQSFEAKGGKVIAEVTFNPKQTTYAAELQKLASVNPKAAYLGAAVESGATLLKDASQAGYKWQWIGDADFAVPEIFNLVGKDVVEGIRVSTTAGDTSSQSWKDYVAAFNAKFKYEPTGAYVANMQDAMVIMALAMVKAGANTGAGLNQAYKDVANPPGDVVRTFAEGVAALKAGKDINYEGVTGPCDFDQYGNVSGSFQELIATNGAWVPGKQYPAGSIQ